MKFKKEKFLSNMDSSKRIIIFKLPYSKDSIYLLVNRMKFEQELLKNKEINIISTSYPYIYDEQYKITYNSTLSTNKIIDKISQILSNQDFYLWQRT